MKKNLPEQELDRILAQPAQIADLGFTKNMNKVLRASDARRVWAFTTVALSWGLLSLLLISPELVAGHLAVFNAIWDSLYSSILQSLPLREILVTKLSLDVPPVGAIVSIGLVIALARQFAEE